MTFPQYWSIIKEQGDARCERTPPRGGNPTVATNTKLLHSRETSPQHVSRLVSADGSLLFIVQIQYERHDTGDRAQGPKDSQQCRSHMYIASLGKISRGAVYTPPFRSAGWQATVFYRAPSTKEEKTRLGRWASTCIPLYSILSNCQTNQRKINHPRS